MGGTLSYTPAPKARRMAFIATLVTGLLCILSLMSVNGQTLVYPFIMVPTFAIYLWPQGANPIISLVGVVLMGFWLDHISFGPTGLWALTWLVLFITYRPDTRAKPQGYWGQFAGAVLTLFVICLFHTLLGATVLGRPMDIFSAGLSVGTACFVFPFFYVIREYFARSYGNRDDYYYEAPSK